MFNNIDVSDNFKKYKFLVDFLNKSGANRYAKKYPKARSGREMGMLTCLLKSYPVFTKNEDGYLLHLYFSKNNSFAQKQIDKYKSDLIGFLKEATKKDFQVTTLFFIPGCERDIYEETKHEREAMKRMRAIEETKAELERQKELENIMKQEFILFQETEKVKREGTDNSNNITASEETKQIIDPFGKGFLVSTPKSKLQSLNQSHIRR